jgi:hypothetical protein
MSRATGKLVVHHRSDGVAMGTLDAFFVMRCFGAVTPDDIQFTLKCGEILRAYRPYGSASMVAVDPTATFPSEATRRAALSASRETSPQTVAVGLIVLGDGFWASAIRGVLMTVTSLTPTDGKRKIVRHEEEAIDFVIDVLGESPAKYRAALLSALTQLKPVAPAASLNQTPSTSNAPAAGSKAPVAVSKAPPSSKRRSGSS